VNYEFESRRIRNSRFSLRAWARQLGYQNPSFLAHILKKECALKIDVAEKFTVNLGLSGNKKKYFEVLVLLRNSKTVDEKKIYLELLDSLRPKSTKPPQSLSVEAFRVISDWYHTAIKDSPVFLETYIPSDAIRHFHSQMIDKARVAIEDQAINERDIRGSMLSIREKDYSKVQEIIKRAHTEILKISCDGDGEELYQFNTQFFRITKKKEDL
jgi:hypothetical protein